MNLLVQISYFEILSLSFKKIQYTLITLFFRILGHQYNQSISWCTQASVQTLLGRYDFGYLRRQQVAMRFKKRFSQQMGYYYRIRDSPIIPLFIIAFAPVQLMFPNRVSERTETTIHSMFASCIRRMCIPRIHGTDNSCNS